MTTQSPKSVNAEVELILEEYLSFKTLPFAILIKGEWGTGKTHFVNSFLQRRKESHSEGYNEIFCYVSLFGLSTPEEIHKSVISKIAIEIDSPVSSAASLICNTMSFFSFSGLEIRKDNILSSINKKIIDKIKSKTVIYIFDDFERCSADRTTLLGVINSYLSDDNSKVIIIANEDKLASECNQDSSISLYREIKEKVIGATLQIKPEFKKALQQAVDSITDDKGFKYLIENNQNIILDVFKAGNIINLRMLQKIIFEFLRIYTSFDSSIKSDEKFISKLIENHSAHSILVHSGKKIEDLSQSGLFSTMLAQRELGALEKIIQSANFPDSFWLDFYTSGVVTDEIQKYYISTTGTKDKAPPIILWDFFNIESDKVVFKTLDKMNEDLENYVYTDIGMILMAFSIKLSLSNANIINVSRHSIVKEAKNYINKIEFDKDDLLEFPQKLNFRNYNKYAGSYEGLMFPRDEYGDFFSIVEILQKKRLLLLKHVFADKLYALLGSPFDSNSFYRNLVDIWWRYEGTHVGLAIKPEELTQRLYMLEGRDMLTTTTNMAKHFLESIRVNNDATRKDLEKWLKKMLSSFRGKYRRESAFMKRFHCKNTIENLEKLIASAFPEESSASNN